VSQRVKTSSDSALRPGVYPGIWSDGLLEREAESPKFGEEMAASSFAYSQEIYLQQVG
jgi:hypothetical protein